MFSLPVILGAAIIPTITGFLWYNPKTFQNVWMEASGMTEEKMKGGNMALIFGISLLVSILLSIQMHSITIHQNHMMSLFFGSETPETTAFMEGFMATYGELHRSFTHGVVHGIFAGLFFVLPVMGTNALFERKGFKYILVNVGYWTFTLALMGGVICQFG